MFGAEGGAGSSGQPVCRPCVTSPRYCAVTLLASWDGGGERRADSVYTASPNF